MNVNRVNRFEIIDYTPCGGCNGKGRRLTETDSAAGQSIAYDVECPVCHGSGAIGRKVVFHDQNKQIELSLQDDGTTLKIFIKERV